MAVIIKNRTIRPSTRNLKSAYRVRVVNAEPDDTVIIFIDHESMDYRSIYKCSGELFQENDSIHFKVLIKDNTINIRWQSGKIPELIR